MGIRLKVIGRGTVEEVARYLYGNSRVVASEEEVLTGRVTVIVELDGVEPQVQIDRYASGLFGARIIDSNEGLDS